MDYTNIMISDSAESSSDRIETTQICLEKGIHDAPVASGYVLDDAGALQQLEHPVAYRWCKAPRDWVAPSKRAGHL